MIHVKEFAALQFQPPCGRMSRPRSKLIRPTLGMDVAIEGYDTKRVGAAR